MLQICRGLNSEDTDKRDMTSGFESPLFNGGGGGVDGQMNVKEQKVLQRKSSQLLRGQKGKRGVHAPNQEMEINSPPGYLLNQVIRETSG